MPHVPRIALLIDTSTDYSSQVIKGVSRFVRTHRPWQLLVQPRGESERTSMPRHWQADGAIARITHRAIVRDLARRQIPVVNVSLSVVPGTAFPQVTIDEALVGAWAAEHLLERGLRRFGYCGNWSQLNYVDRCGPAFVKVVERSGCACSTFRPIRAASTNHRPPTPAGLQRWLRSLSPPVGIFAADANDAHVLREQCRLCGLRIPDDVALVAGEDDELLCAISHPPLSCIDLGSERIGYAAAQLLGRLLAGRAPPKRPRYLPPMRVVARHSTDTLAIDDPDIARAVRYIRQNASAPIQVRDILREVPLSRRVLEQRFRNILGRSPAAEIRRVHIERAKELLISTDWKTPKVAAAAGFRYTEVMNQVFRRELDMTPTEFRHGSRTTSR